MAYAFLLNVHFSPAQEPLHPPPSGGGVLHILHSAVCAKMEGGGDVRVYTLLWQYAERPC